MVVDTSAIMAILLAENEAAHFAAVLGRPAIKRMSTGTLVELEIVTNARRGRIGRSDVEAFLTDANIEIVSFDQDQARLAREAYRRYGKGNHRAGLNFGDCFAYALAKHIGEPLLFKGADFARTDIEPAV